jgi:hypothetical protein
VTFTPEETEALKTLEKVFGPVAEANPLHVEAVFERSYTRSVHDYAGYIMHHWKAAVLAADPELPEIQRKLREENARKNALKNAARNSEIRENLASSILSGLIPKARKAGAVEFEINDWCIDITVRRTDEEEVFNLQFDREDFSLKGHLSGQEFEQEDWSVLNGNGRPRDQSVALRTVLEFLEELD